MSGVFSKLSQSEADFDRALPWIETWFDIDYVHYVEARAKVGGVPIYRLLDWGTGSDYVIELLASPLKYGLSTRFQRVDAPMGTFTLRSWRESGTETEFQKRVKEQADPRCLRVGYHIQGYFSRDSHDLLELGVAPVEAILAMIRHGKCRERETKDEQGLTRFYIIAMDEMALLGLPVSIMRFRNGEIAHSHTAHLEPYDEAAFFTGVDPYDHER